jgi:septal ring-binding cell division protein DamX
MPHMRQLKERITHSFRLEPLLRSDIEAYLDFRMRAAGYRGPNVFAPEAVRRIVKASAGLTRRVNILADKSLLAAFADNEHGISAKHASRAIRDSEFYQPGVSKTKIGLAAGGTAVGLALGLGLHYLLTPATPVIPAQTAPVSAAPAKVLAPAPTEPAAIPPSAAAASAQPGTPPAAAADATTPMTAPAATPVIPAVAAAPKTASAPSEAAPIVQIAAIKDVAAARAPDAAATPAAEPETRAGAKPGSMDYVPPAPSTGRLTRERYAATQEWLKTGPPDQYSIQLLTVGKNDLRRIEEVLARAAARNLELSDFHLYSVRINDKQHYRLAYGLYPDQAAVSQGIKEMPAVYRQFGLFYRSVERMRSQNRQ